jgi:hypothetical protein
MQSVTNNNENVWWGVLDITWEKKVYEISVLQITTDIFRWTQSQSHPFLTHNIP